MLFCFFFWAFEINILPNVLGFNICPITLFGSDFHLAHLTNCFYLNYPKEVLSLKVLSSSDRFGGKEKNTNRNYNNGNGGARRESGSGGWGVRCMEEETLSFCTIWSYLTRWNGPRSPFTGSIFVSATVSSRPSQCTGLYSGPTPPMTIQTFHDCWRCASYQGVWI